MRHPPIQSGTYLIRSTFRPYPGPFMSFLEHEPNDMVRIGIPVVTGSDMAEWVVQSHNDGSGSYCIRSAREETSTYMGTKDDAVFLDSSQQRYDILYHPAGYYRISISGTAKMLKCNGCNGEEITLTAEPDQQISTILWDFELVRKDHPRYQSYDGLFVQDTLTQNDEGVIIYNRFGLKSDTSDRWTKFWEKIHELNAKDSSVIYKLIFFGRQGKAVHNIAMKKYGPNWRDMSRNDGDGVLTWADAELTQEGYLASLHARSVWDMELAADANFKLPKISYCSPLTRCLSTNTITFGRKLKTVVVEDCRERCKGETPERRRNREYINIEGKNSVFPWALIENGFTEKDEVWSPNEQESFYDIQFRALAVLDRIFNDTSDIFASVTTHGEFICAITSVIGRPQYSLPPGGVLPIVIKRTL